MDPDETLVQIRQLMSRSRKPGVTSGERDDLLLELVEHVDAMDLWLLKGGFLPGAWRQNAPL